MTKARTRRRADALMEAIHTATLLELSDRGYTGVSFEGVARRAQTSKPVLYRRYRNRAEMVLDAIGQTAAQQVVAPHKGSLRADVMSVLEQVNQQFSRFDAEVYRGVIGESDDSLLDDALNAVGALNSQTMGVILETARARGELGQGQLPERVVLLPLALLRHELLFGHSVDARTIADIVDQVYVPLVRTLSRGEGSGDRL
ncbi:MAG: TetR/AcrR family transcriptional regulator [Lacisediminihabitans sp.]